MRSVPAAALNVHGEYDIRAQHADEANIIADDVGASPLTDHFLRIEGIAIIDCAREILLGAIDAMRRQQLRRAQHRQVPEQLRPNFVLPAATAVILHIDGSQSHAMREHREQRIVFVVRVRRRLHKRSGHVELPKRESERNMAAVPGHERRIRPALRQDADMVRQRDQDGKAKDAYSCWKDYQAFHVSASGN